MKREDAVDMAGKGILGRKLGMTQVWDGEHRVIPVTVIQAGPCRVVQLKTPERDGYAAVQLAFGATKAQRLSKPELGHLKKADAGPTRTIAELRVDDLGGYEVGQVIAADVFAAGERVDVTGISKGKGFTGAMQRHNFHGQGASHGNHKKHRSPGSIGACATPARVFKGMKMAGQMGAEKVTTLNLEIVSGDADQGLLLVKGAGSRTERQHRLRSQRGEGRQGRVRPEGRDGAEPEAAPSDDARTTRHEAASDERPRKRPRRWTAEVEAVGMKFDVTSIAGAKAGSVDAPDELFGVVPNIPLMHQVVTAQLAHKRAGSHSTKTRAEVAGGGAKPWRQKGTGRARQGSIRSPQWRGGGIAHGPKPRDYTQKTPKKMVRLALCSALSDRAGDPASRSSTAGASTSPRRSRRSRCSRPWACAPTVSARHACCSSSTAANTPCGSRSGTSVVACRS